MMFRLSHKDYVGRQVFEEIVSLIMLLVMSIGAYVMLGLTATVDNAETIMEARSGVIVLATVCLSVWFLWLMSRINHRKRLSHGGLEGGYLNLSTEGVIIALPSMYLSPRLVYLKSEVQGISVNERGTDIVLKIMAKEDVTGLSKTQEVVLTGVTYTDMVKAVKKSGYHPFKRTRTTG